MAITSSQMAPATEPTIHATFRKKYGIPPKGKPPKGGWPDSAYGLPLPPADHPNALKFARAVVSRAHQATNFDPSAVATQVRKAQAIIAKSKKESGLREWSQAVPNGSWERKVGLIGKAAQKSASFGGPANDDPKADDADTVRSYDISVWASFPAESRVIIYNAKTSDAWSATFVIAGDVVTFSNIKPVEITAESRRRKLTPWRECAWYDTHKPNARGGFVRVTPRKGETAKQFLERVPGAKPKSMVEHLSRAQKQIIEAKSRGAKMREGAVMERGATELRERGMLPSNLAFREAAFDQPGDGEVVVKNVLLLREGPGNTGDRHWYSANCIVEASASGIFEGAQSYFDHPSTIEEQTRPERSVEKLAAWYSDVHCREYRDPKLGRTVQGLFADMHLVVGNKVAASLVRTCVEYAKKYPRRSFAGLSIYAAGDSAPGTMDGENWNIVNRITYVESVDIVTRAGAGGSIVPLKESQTMKNAQDNVKLVINGDAVKTSVTELIEKQKSGLITALTKLKEAGVTLTAEQEASLTSAVGELNEAALETVLENATSVAEGETPTVEADPAADDEPDTDDPVELKKQLKAARAKAKAAESKVAESQTRMTEAERQANAIVRERMADEVLVERNIPETFRPRLKQELVREGGVTKKAMTDYANAFDLAFIRPHLDGSGVVAGTMRESGTAKGGNFNFDEEC